MIWKTLIFLLALAFLLPVSARAQTGDEDYEDENLYISRGLNQYGSTGLFRTPSAAIMRPSQLGIGVFVENSVQDASRTGLPISIGYGVARLSEAFAFFQSHYDPEERVNEDIAALGLKVLLLQPWPILLSTDIQVENVIRGYDNDVGEKFIRSTGRLILNYNIGSQIGFSLYGGYSWIQKTLERQGNAYIAGLGLLLPLSKSILLIGEASGKQYLARDIDYEALIGAKYFFKQHFQLSAGVRGTMREGSWRSGIFLGLSFSSQILQARNPDEDDENYFPELPSLDALEEDENTPVDQGGEEGGGEEGGGEEGGEESIPPVESPDDEEDTGPPPLDSLGIGMNLGIDAGVPQAFLFGESVLIYRSFAPLWGKSPSTFVRIPAFRWKERYNRLNSGYLGITHGMNFALLPLCGAVKAIAVRLTHIDNHGSGLQQDVYNSHRIAADTGDSAEIPDSVVDHLPVSTSLCGILRAA